MNEWRQVCSKIPLRASTRTIARVGRAGTGDHVTRTGCAPGVSAMMNLRFGVYAK